MDAGLIGRRVLVSFLTEASGKPCHPQIQLTVAAIRLPDGNAYARKIGWRLLSIFAQSSQKCVGSVEWKVLVQAQKKMDVWILRLGAVVFQPARCDDW